MSVYSTVFLTKDECIREIKRALNEKEPLESLSNEELEDMLFNLVGDESLPNSRLENFSIID